MQRNLVTRNEQRNTAMTIFEVAGSCARRLAKSLTCVSLLLASAGAVADNPPLSTQIVDLANKVDGVHPGFRAFLRRQWDADCARWLTRDAAWHRHQVPPARRSRHRHGDQLVQVLPGGDRRGLS